MSLELNQITDPPSQIQIRHHGQNDEEESGRFIAVLPPADYGPAAWRYLFGCFVIEATVWGFALSFGIFQEYYSRQPEFENNPNIAVIGTVSTSIYFLGAPIATPLVKRYQRWQRPMVAIGSAICALSLLAASFVSSVTLLIVTQGAMFGFGFLVLYFPVLSMLEEWFVQRRGLAYGLLYAGSGFSGIGFPFLLEWLLTSYGYRTTLRIVAITQFVLIAPSLPLIKPRTPPSQQTSTPRMDFSFLKRPLFWVFMISNLFQGLGYYIPSLFLPTYASLLGLSGTTGSLLLAANSFAITVGQVVFGHISDRFRNVYILLFICSFFSSVSALTIWGLAGDWEVLLVFALIYGFFAGSYSIFWPRYGSLVSADSQQVYGLMAFGKGIGNIVTGPISAGLLAMPSTPGYGLGAFGPVIIFLGSMMFCSSLGIVGWPISGIISP